MQTTRDKRWAGLRDMSLPKTEDKAGTGWTQKGINMKEPRKEAKIPRQFMTPTPPYRHIVLPLLSSHFFKDSFRLGYLQQFRSTHQTAARVSNISAT